MSMSYLFPFIKMKKLSLLIFLSIIVTSLCAQKLDVESFRKLSDMDARVNYPVLDQNGEKCAIIKVSTNQEGFVFEGDGLGITDVVKKTAEYWVYVPNGAKRLTIKHDLLGLKRYVYPEAIEEAASYELSLISGVVEKKVLLADNSEWVVFKSQPKGADVYVDENYIGETPLTKQIAIGKHTYRIEKSLYHSVAGVFKLRLDKKQTFDKELKPNFGWGYITTSPESGAEVLVDGIKQNGKTPYKTGRLLSGKHTITVRKDLYAEQSKEILIKDNKTTDAEINISAQFGKLNISSTPVSGAEVIIDGVSTGKRTPCTIDKIASGEHTVKLRVKWYEPRMIKVRLSNNEDKNVEIKLNPTFGKVTITATEGSDIYIDNNYVAKGEYSARLVAGVYNIEARKDKHHTFKHNLQIQVGENKTVNLTPKPKYGKIEVTSTPFDADIFLNGKKVGTTPKTIRKVLIGKYQLKVKKADCATVEREVIVEEDKVSEMDVNLEKTKKVYISSSPSNAKLFINDKYVGYTPMTRTLNVSKYKIRIEKAKYVTTEKVVDLKNDNPNIIIDLPFDEELRAKELSKEERIKEGKQFRRQLSWYNGRYNSILSPLINPFMDKPLFDLSIQNTMVNSKQYIEIPLLMRVEGMFESGVYGSLGFVDKFMFSDGFNEVSILSAALGYGFHSEYWRSIFYLKCGVSMGRAYEVSSYDLVEDRKEYNHLSRDEEEENTYITYEFELSANYKYRIINTSYLFVTAGLRSIDISTDYDEGKKNDANLVDKENAVGHRLGKFEPFFGFGVTF